ncbi:MAG: YegP family protein, partial [Bacteroidota bacterium]
MRFAIRQQADEQFVFELRDGDRLLLASRPFADREAAVAAVRATIDAIEEADGYEVEETDAGYVLRVTDADDNVLAETPATSAEASAASIGDALLDGAARTDDYEVTITTTTTDSTAVPIAFRSMRETDPVDYYDFDAIGASRVAGGHAFEQDGEYYYVVNDSDGQPLLFTRHYGTAGPRNKRMRSLLEAAGRDTRYETVEENGQHYFIVKARNGMEIARSRAFASAAAMTTAMGFLKGYAPDAYQDVKTTRRRGGGSDSNDYDFTLAGTTNTPGFDAYRAGPGQFVFLFNDEDGQPILFSQGYSGRSSRDNGIKAVIRNAGEDGRYELKEENGEHYFILRAGNRREIARSRAFPSAAAALAAMAFLQRQAPTYADQYGVLLVDQSRTTTETESFTIHVDPREAAGGVLGAAALGMAGAAMLGGDAEVADVTDAEDETEDAGGAVAGAAVVGLGAGTGAGVAGAPLSAGDDEEEAGGAAVPLAGAAAVGGAATSGATAASATPASSERVTPVAAAAGGASSGAAAGAAGGAAGGSAGGSMAGA